MFEALISSLKDERDSQIREQQRKIESLEEICQDLESTIGQFRELVLQFQTWVVTITSDSHRLC